MNLQSETLTFSLKRTVFRLLFLTIFSTCSVVFAEGNSGLVLKGVDVPGEITCGEAQLVLNGTAVRKKYGFSVYVVALYLNSPKNDHKDIMTRDRLGKRVHITMLRQVSGETFNSTIQKNIDTNFSDSEREEFASELEDFMACFDSGAILGEGSVVNIDFLPGVGTEIAVNGHVNDIIPGEEFYHAVLRLWIGDPPQESLKTGLLGQLVN